MSKMNDYIYHLKEVIRLGKELGGSPQMIANDIICLGSGSPDVQIKRECHALLDSPGPVSGH